MKTPANKLQQRVDEIYEIRTMNTGKAEKIRWQMQMLRIGMKTVFSQVMLFRFKVEISSVRVRETKFLTHKPIGL